MKANNLNKAIDRLKSSCGVIPEKYTMYRGAYLFLAYPPDVKDKTHYIGGWYLVDLSENAVGPFSPVFDMNGFKKATENLKNL